ncbi:MAG TPA: hypothetical protein VFT09_11540 [Ilumatobacteraceae bacterium]|nr:hypothetical protein [Ilumatobacteraceae bacterium]
MSASVARSVRWLVGFGLAIVVTVGVSGCFTGERPTLADGPVMTGDPNVDAVLERLDQAPQAVFSADYDVLTRFGDVTRAASVVQAGPSRRSITVGSIRFLVEDSATATCDLETSVCTDTIDAARISDTQLAPDFYATSAATRLRRDANGRTGDTVASTAEIAGQPATCVAVPVTERIETYCALDNGPLARIDAADVLIELTAYANVADESKFARAP